MTAVVPLTATQNQTLSVAVGSDPVRLDVYQLRTGLFMNVWKDNVRLVSGAICLTNTYIIRAPYLGLPGDFIFVDTQGNADPDYTGLGSRWLLYYEAT